MMSTLRASAAEFVPSFGNPNAIQCFHPTETQQHGTHQQQVQKSDRAEQQHSYSQQDYGYEDGYYDESGNWVSYVDDEDGLQQQEWREEYDWVPYDHEQHQQEVDAQFWQDTCWQQQQPQQQQQKASSTAAAATTDDDNDSSWNDVSISSQQAVQLLQSWYPGQSAAMLTQLLEACEGRLQDALQLLSELGHEAQQAIREQQSAAAASQRAADGDEIDAAASRAGWGSAAAATVKQPKQQQPAFNLHKELFPDLSTAAAAAATGKQQQQQQQTAAMWDKPAAGQGSSISSNWSAVAAKAAAAQGRATAGVGTTASIQPSSAAKQPHSSSSNNVRVGASSAAAAVPWVETGEAVSQEYAAARAEASDYARIRNACFHQATIAYLAGDKALAKELSAKGKQAAQQMWQAHERASQQIFTQRNAQLAAAATSKPGGSSSSSAAGVIDLHGLHVREVKAMLPQQLAKLVKQQQQHVSLIVGTGHHTKGPPTARVGPAVEALLHELGYKYRQVQPGLLRVQLQ